MQATTPAQLIAQSDHAWEINSLKKERDRVNVLDKVEAMLAIAARCDGGLAQGRAVRQVARSYHGRRGFSPSKLGADYQLWRKGGQKQDAQGRKSGPLYQAGDWRIFLPNYSNGNQAAALRNADFVRYVQRLFADTCREDATGNALFERVLDHWFAGDDVPGYGNIRQFCAAQARPVPRGPLARSRPENYPTGWSPKNLTRMLPSKTKRVYIQRGEHAAHSHWGDQLLRDRSRLMPFELITFDDVRFDLKVIQPIPGKAAQVVYPEALFALDVATGMILAKAVLGTYTRTEDGDGGTAGTRRAFQHADMRWLMSNLLEQYGLPQDWQMHVLLENASASMAGPDIDAFSRATGIEFEKTGLIRQKLTSSGFVEQGGMPWQKGWIEALFRLVHTRTNHLPGTIGARYDLTNGRRPQEEKYTLNTLIEAHKQGIPIDQLQLPLLTIDQYHDLLDQYVHLLNWRTRHKLQGFDQVHELQYEPGKYIRHDDPLCAQLVTVGSKFLSRMEAPAERFAKLMQGHRMQPVHPRNLIPLALEKRPVTVAAERVTITRRGGDPLVFRDAETARALAQWNGQKKALIAYLSADESQIHLFTNDADQTYICSPRRVGRIDITDEKAVLARSGEVHRGREQTRHYAAQLCADQDLQYQAMRQHNDTALGRDACPQASANVQHAIESAEADTARRTRRPNITDAEADNYFATAPNHPSHPTDPSDPSDDSLDNLF